MSQNAPRDDKWRNNDVKAAGSIPIVIAHVASSVNRCYSKQTSDGGRKRAEVLKSCKMDTNIKKKKEKKKHHLYKRSCVTALIVTKPITRHHISAYKKQD